MTLRTIELSIQALTEQRKLIDTRLYELGVGWKGCANCREMEQEYLYDSLDDILDAIKELLDAKDALQVK